MSLTVCVAMACDRFAFAKGTYKLALPSAVCACLLCSVNTLPAEKVKKFVGERLFFTIFNPLHLCKEV